MIARLQFIQIYIHKLNIHIDKLYTQPGLNTAMVYSAHNHSDTIKLCNVIYVYMYVCVQVHVIKYMIS